MRITNTLNVCMYVCMYIHTYIHTYFFIIFDILIYVHTHIHTGYLPIAGGRRVGTNGPFGRPRCGIWDLETLTSNRSLFSRDTYSEQNTL